jgi:Icc-related predicted phosphoesterase
MLLVSDVHGAFHALARVARTGEPLLVLGDLLNLMDYRTGEGITAEVLGLEFARETARARGAGDYGRMRELWQERVGDRRAEFRAAFDAAVERQYREAGLALAGATAWVTFGNVDRPSLLRSHLPEGVAYVDGDVFEVEGVRIGMVGGGIATPLHAAGEVTDDDMRAKLERMGPVDVLCSHLPPAIGPLHTDVVTGRHERASLPILEYLREVRPAWHFFGDVHQPQATAWRVGPTRCRNVGYFRATERAVRFDA